MNKIVVILIILLSVTVIFQPCLAEETIIKSISPNPYYDSKPSVWGNYIVWRRGINQNDNSYIDLYEPSWIMVYNIETRNTYNITPILQFLYGDKYYHAEAPEIWNNKIIYEAQAGGNSTDTHLYMYDIDTKETKKMPLKSSTTANGHLSLIYNDWIVYTDKQNDKKQAYLFNYNNGVYRTILGKGSNYSIYGIVMHENNVVLTVYNQTNVFEIWNYNIETTVTDKIITNSTQIMATSVYNNLIGLTKLNIIDNETFWSICVHDTLLNRTYFELDNTFGILVDLDGIVYESGNNIIIETNLTTVEIPSLYNQYLGDKYNNILVWMDNSNSNTTYGDARDDFDIYVRIFLSNEQIAVDMMYLIIPVIIIVIIVAYAYKDRLRSQI